ncbi:MAG: right-handed parallel beta-helix repeat-containing protein [Phaeodactylibacter sp.]|nr:right-handed parallel beta-helix repeat-containing protein [Phaeodactylibacter sp.]MCB9048845.1 right-handed parallel beta-helix repeat-containing protein [Lewinellaceae bacterium]
MPRSVLLPFLLGLALGLASCQGQPGTPASIPLQPGLVITSSTTITPGAYRLAGPDSLHQPLVVIEGEDITVDFNGAEMNGATGDQRPNQYSGLAVLVRNSRNVTIRNLKARGYKIALMAENTDSLLLEHCDLSYNYRQRLQSIREREDLADWLSYHDNEADEWLRYGAAVYLKGCNHATVRYLSVTGGQNGLMLTQCNNGLFYNNTIHFNSGIGIGLYRSSNNKVMHNRLDWNVRGYSHGFYSRGQDSAGILCYEQSSNNTFAYNSATHSGDGFFLWAGQSSMDSGEGGCNDNIIFGNDFSHAPTNGIEVTFSRNILANNQLEDCTYGVWGGYSFETLITGNTICECRHGVAIEHGQDNAIVRNYFAGDSIGVQLWERDQQPEDWGYAQAKDVSSRDYEIQHNYFVDVKVPLKISGTDKVAINDDNQFYNFERLLLAEKPNRQFYFVKNDVCQPDKWGDATAYKKLNRISEPPLPEELEQWPGLARDLAPVGAFEPQPLPDGMNAMLPDGHVRGRKFILVNEWGPYDFLRPSIWLRDIRDSLYTFLLLGPQGNWRLNGGQGFTGVNPKTGTFPATITAVRDSTGEELKLGLEFIGEEVTGQFGEQYKRGATVPFGFYRFEKKLDWKVRFYEYNESTHPLSNYEAFRQLKEQKPDAEEQVQELAYAWWKKPAPGVNADRFATFASTSFEITPGRYKVSITSDDGLRFFVDGQLVIGHWDVHEPETDEAVLELSGRHTFEIEHFEAGGFATLSFHMQRLQ